MLSAKAEPDKTGEGDMYNPWYNILKKEGRGTLMYSGSWNLFDQIVMTPNMVNKKGSKDYSTLKYWKNQIFSRPYLFQTEGNTRVSPSVPRREEYGSTDSQTIFRWSYTLLRSRNEHPRAADTQLAV